MIADLIRETPVDILKAVVEICDGHTIFKPEAFLKKGWNKEIVDHFTANYGSNGECSKEIIYNKEGEALLYCRGVYGLFVLYGIAKALGVKYMQCFGRGSQARMIKEALNQYWEGKA